MYAIGFFKVLLLCLFVGLSSEAYSYSISGRVIDGRSREPLPYVNVTVAGRPDIGTATDIDGNFTIGNVEMEVFRLSVSYVGYKPVLTPEYRGNIKGVYVEIEMEEDATALEGVTVTSPSAFKKLADAPVSLRFISVQEIEKSPGANRDISRIVRSYPGVSYSPAGYRNDLIVRGGSPSENRFYLDGIEIPNINHFSTQGASGGPTGIINSDFIREVGFYTGSFPVDKGNALSSVLDFKLKDGDLLSNNFKATLGAAEVSFTGDGHIGDKVTYLVSLRQSYLQLLFKFLGLPFMPQFTDGQFKVKARIDSRNELTVLGLFGVDNMQLNTSITGESAEYLLSYLPVIRQETFTLGAVYKHYGSRGYQSLSLGHSYLNNRNTKYAGNDDSSEDNLTLRLRSVEQKTSLRFENKTYLGLWTWNAGAELSYATYGNDTYSRIFIDRPLVSEYDTRLGIPLWGVFSSAAYESASGNLTASFGLRSDGAGYSRNMANMLKTLSPRASVSYDINSRLDLSASAGLYYQLPPYTALGYKNNDGEYVNKDLEYMRVAQATVGAGYSFSPRASVTAELFFKHYSDVPLSVADNIPLACKGNDYGVVGNEELRSSAEGRSYGVELLGKWQIPEKVTLISSLTLYRSEYRNDRSSRYVVSAWDNRFIWNMSGIYEFPHRWSVGAKLSCIGGAPYTPYDIDKSSLIDAWNASGRPYLDYSRYNEKRLSAYAQLDVRVDKVFVFPRTRLGLYVDLQNATMSKYRQPDVPMSTGVVDPSDPTRYQMKYVKQEYGTIVPTIGVSVEF